MGHPPGDVLFEAHLWPGSELGWERLGGQQPLANSVARVRNFHLKDPNWEPSLDNAGSDIERATTMDGGLVASNNFNLKPFFGSGGKLLMWHGWDDPQVPAQHSITFYEEVLDNGGAGAADSIALFLLPGVAHCGGGPGADTFNRMAAIEEWVETGRVPESLTVTHRTAGVVDDERKVCAFPARTVYSGPAGGASDRVNWIQENFSCQPD